VDEGEFTDSEIVVMLGENGTGEPALMPHPRTFRHSALLGPQSSRFAGGRTDLVPSAAHKRDCRRRWSTWVGQSACGQRQPTSRQAADVAAELMQSWGLRVDVRTISRPPQDGQAHQCDLYRCPGKTMFIRLLAGMIQPDGRFVERKECNPENNATRKRMQPNQDGLILTL